MNISEGNFLDFVVCGTYYRLSFDYIVIFWRSNFFTSWFYL